MSGNINLLFDLRCARDDASLFGVKGDDLFSKNI